MSESKYVRGCDVLVDTVPPCNTCSSCGAFIRVKEGITIGIYHIYIFRCPICGATYVQLLRGVI